MLAMIKRSRVMDRACGLSAVSNNWKSDAYASRQRCSASSSGNLSTARIQTYLNGGRFSGKIDNTPRTVRSVAAGQIIEFSEGEITDWMYMDGGKMKGNYSACALLQREPKDQQDAVKNRFGLNCDA